jgi:hypothetical protein
VQQNGEALCIQRVGFVAAGHALLRLRWLAECGLCRLLHRIDHPVPVAGCF